MAYLLASVYSDNCRVACVRPWQKVGECANRLTHFSLGRKVGECHERRWRSTCAPTLDVVIRDYAAALLPLAERCWNDMSIRSTPPHAYSLPLASHTSPPTTRRPPLTARVPRRRRIQDASISGRANPFSLSNEHGRRGQPARLAADNNTRAFRGTAAVLSTVSR